MSSIKTTYDDPALAGKAIARDQAPVLLLLELFGGSRE
jgi:hypothetical protein